MLCQGCHTSSRGFLCPRCRAQLRPAPERILDGGIRLVAAFEHEGVARELVHGLKYRGMTSFADLVVASVSPRVPPLPVVPVPRTWSRQVRYGIDPAREIGLRLARAMGVPLIDLFSAPLHAPRRAGGDHNRPPPELKAAKAVLGPVVLVDDVVTTGATITSAVKTLGSERIALVLAATLADTVSSPRRSNVENT
jgi:predicted amidophosphoribosyltransferase